MTNYIESDDDEDLKLAIALSLGQKPSELGTEGSEAGSEPNVAVSTSRRSEVAVDPTSGAKAATHTLQGILGLDRKKMEEQRLARLNQRKRTLDDSGHGTTETQDFKKRIKAETAPAAATPSTVSKVALTKVLSDSSTKPSTGSKISDTQTSLRYPKGRVLKTYSAAHSRQGDITVEEVLQKEDLLMLVISSFQWDFEWLMSKVNPAKTKVVMCMAAKTESERAQYRREAEQTGFQILCCFPPMEGETNAMHSKLMLLSYAHGIRIVVTSANAVPYDWGETGVMENSVFVMDLPRLGEGMPAQSEKDLSPFGKELRYFLQKSNMPGFVTDGLLKFDFVETGNMAFVHSVGGASFGQDLRRTGFNSLATGIRQLELDCAQGQDLHLHFASASLGALNDGMLNTIHTAAKGNILSDNTRTKSASSAVANTKVRDYFKIYFPTGQTVAMSRGGVGCGGTVCARREWVERKTFPLEVMRDYRSTRKGLLSHNKLLLGHNNLGNLAWVYVGSANLSESAWGKIVKDGKRKENKMVCRNWECGVLLPVPPGDDEKKATDADFWTRDGELARRFCPLLDIPFEVPGQHYGDKEPWYFMER